MTSFMGLPDQDFEQSSNTRKNDIVLKLCWIGPTSIRASSLESNLPPVETWFSDVRVMRLKRMAAQTSRYFLFEDQI